MAKGYDWQRFNERSGEIRAGKGKIGEASR